MGAWRYIFPLLHDLASSRAEQAARSGYVGPRREPRARRPASTKAHKLRAAAASSKKRCSEGPRMAVELTVPQLGESITEAVVGKWHKKVGEPSSRTSRWSCSRPTRSPSTCPAPAAGALEPASPTKEGDKVKRRRRARAASTPGRRRAPLLPPPRRPGRRATPAPAAAPAAASAGATRASRPVARRRGRGQQAWTRPGEGHRRRRPHHQGGRARPC